MQRWDIKFTPFCSGLNETCACVILFVYGPVLSGVQGGGSGAPIVGDISDCLSDK